MTATLSAQHVVKHYGGVIALADGSLTVEAGQVVALLGANGSGKSTLSKIITGVVSPDAGTLTVDGRTVLLSSPQDAQKLEIAAVYQELSLIPDMTVSENIWLTHEPLRGMRLDHKEMRARTEALIDLFAGTTSSLMPDAVVKSLPPDERQITEILKAISREPRWLLLDEATASLDREQVNRLFELVRGWKAKGMGIVFISHRMDEIFEIADRATVLRSGYTVGEARISETTREALITLMIEGASAMQRERPRAVPDSAPVRLEVRNLSTAALKNISFTVRDGELLGIGGLHGQGQEELLMALFGAVPSQGEIILSGQRVRFRHPRDAMNHDIALVPGDRAAEGLLLIRSILDNIHLPSWAKFGTPLNMKKARAEGQAVAEELGIVMASLDAPVSSLSGGNAQKVVVGKWLSRSPKVLLLNDPMKGVDVGAKASFYELLAQLSERGMATLFYSSDDDELLQLCHRVLVFQDGRVTAELSGAELTRAALVAASMGAHRADSAREAARV